MNYKYHLFFISLLCNSVYAETQTGAQPVDWKINSKKASVNYQTNQISYLADAVFSDQNLTINGEEILSQASREKKDEYVEVKGKPAYLIRKDQNNSGTIELWANSVKYQTQSKTITASKKVRFHQKSKLYGEFTISGESFVITQDKHYQLAATGSPVSVSIKQMGEVPINAEAKKLLYKQQTQELELTGAVTLIRQQSKMTAEKILYNVKTQTLRIPKSSKRQLNLLQNKKTKK